MKEPDQDFKASAPRLPKSRANCGEAHGLPDRPGCLCDCGHLPSTSHPVPLWLPPHHHKVTCITKTRHIFSCGLFLHALRLFFTLPLTLINLVLFSLAFVQRQALLALGRAGRGSFITWTVGMGDWTGGFFAITTAKVCVPSPNWKNLARVPLIAPPW